MKIRLLIIIGIIVAIAVGGIISLVYNQEIKLATGIMTSDEKPQPSMVSDPVCFVVDRTRSDNIGSGVTMDTCISLKQFEEMGCTKPMLEHLYTYSNILDEHPVGDYVIETIGLPDGISHDMFQECVDIIIEKRPMFDSRHKDNSLAEQETENSNVSITPHIGKTRIYKLDYDKKIFDMHYSITGASIEKMVFSNATNSLLIQLESVTQGGLEIAIPRELLDAKFDYCPPIKEDPPDDKFLVLLDGVEIIYDETVTDSLSRTLKMQFDEHSKKIEIISTCLI